MFCVQFDWSHNDTTSNCKKNNEVKSKNDHLIDFNETNTHVTTSEALVTPSTTTDATVNSFQCPALSNYVPLDDKPMDRVELTYPPEDLLTSPILPFLFTI